MENKPLISAEGIKVQTFSEIYSELADEYKKVYGDDIDLAQNTPDGQKIGIEAKLSLDLQTFGLSLYNSLDPDLAFGEQLNRIIKFCGIRRKPPTRSSVKIQIVMTYKSTLPKGYVVRDENNQNWITISDYSLSAGINNITMYAQNWGKVEAPAGTITKPVTIILGVKSVTNIEAAKSGTDEETDEELRIRRNRSFENAAYSTLGNLYVRLSDLPDVNDLLIYENKTADYDESLDLKPHSLWVIIDGGDTAEIAETIARNKTGGTGLKGSKSGVWVESVTRPDGSIFYYTHEMLWDNSAPVELFVRLKVKRKKADIPINIDAIKRSISNISFNIAESVVVTEFYSNVYSGGNTFTAFDLEFSKDGEVWTENTLVTGADKRFLILIDNITIEETYD